MPRSQRAECQEPFKVLTLPLSCPALLMLSISMHPAFDAVAGFRCGRFVGVQFAREWPNRWQITA